MAEKLRFSLVQKMMPKKSRTGLLSEFICLTKKIKINEGSLNLKELSNQIHHSYLLKTIQYLLVFILQLN